MQHSGILPAEFAARRKAAAEQARLAGFDGLIVCSRGGGGLDRYADVMYLTNFYTSFPYIPDAEGQWTARAHAFLVLPVDGAAHLIADMPDYGQIRLEDGKVSNAALVLDETIAALRAAGLGTGRIGLVGSDVLAFNMYRRLTMDLPGLRLEPADHILARLRMIKTRGEVALLRRASQIGSRMLDAMMDAVRPGVSHGDILAAGMQVLLPNGGALYNSFMASGRGGEEKKLIRNSFPTWGAKERLETGDWFRAGISGVVDGYVFDLSRARPIGSVGSRQVELFEAAISSVETGIAAVKAGATAGDLADAGLGKQRALGFPVKGVFSALGHGVGLGWDSPWLISGDETKIVPDMVLCFERTVTDDNGFLGDFEETVVVTEQGVEKLTDARIRYWS